MAQAVAAGQFRRDLFYRLTVFTVHLRPLRERAEDVLLLADYFLKTLAPSIGVASPGFSEEARQVLLNHDWPGNIRELQNAVERALILPDGEPATPEQLGIPTALRPTLEAPSPDRPTAPEGFSSASLRDVERQLVFDALTKANGNKSHAARLLGLTRFQLYTRLKRFGLES